MTKDDLQKVREALETAPPGANTGSVMEWSKWYANRKQALAILDNALAQPEQEPVAELIRGEGGYDYRSYDDNENYRDDWERRNPNHKGWVEPLYAAPVAQPVNQMLVEALKDMGMRYGLTDIARAALAAVGEK